MEGKNGVSPGKAIIHGNLTEARGKRNTEMGLGIGDSFQVYGFNCVEKWKLVGLETSTATFDVRGKGYGCTDFFAIFLGIPSARWHWIVTANSKEPLGLLSSQLTLQ